MIKQINNLFLCIVNFLQILGFVNLSFENKFLSDLGLIKIIIKI